MKTVSVATRRKYLYSTIINHSRGYRRGGDVEVEAHAISPVTGRRFHASVSAELTDEEFENFVKMTAEQKEKLLVIEKERVLQKFQDFVLEDSRILELFKVSIKKISYSLEDLEMLSRTDLLRIVDVESSARQESGELSADELRDLLERLGCLSSAEEELGPAAASWEVFKQALINLKKDYPNFQLGTLARKASTRTSLQESTSEDLFVDRQGHAAVLKTGEVLGNPVETPKISTFIKKMALLLETADKQQLFSLAKIFKNLESAVLKTDIESVYLNALNKNELVNVHGMDPSSTALKCAFLSPERTKERIQDLLHDGYGYDYYDLSEEEALAKLQPGADRVKVFLERYTELCKKEGPYFIERFRMPPNQANELARNDLQEVAAAVKILSGLKPAVLKQLADQKKPVTKRRVQTAAQQYIDQADTSGCAYRIKNMFGYSVERAFTKEIEASAEIEAQKKAVREAKPKKKTKFSTARIQKPETAASTLQEKYQELTAEQREDLLQKVTSSSEAFAQMLADTDSQELITLVVMKQGRSVMSLVSTLEGQGWVRSRSQVQAAVSKACRGFVAAGIPEAAPWAHAQSREIYSHVSSIPDQMIPACVETVLSECDLDALDVDALSSLMARLERGADGGLKEKETNESGRNRFSDFLAKVPEAAKKVIRRHAHQLFEGDRMATVAHSSEGTAESATLGLNDLNSVLLSPELSLHYFAVYHQAGKKEIAARCLKAAVEMDSDHEVPPHLATSLSHLHSSKFGSGPRTWGELVIKPEILRMYAHVFTPKIIADGKPLSRYKKYWGSGGSDLELVQAFFAGSGLNQDEQLHFLENAYGKEDAVYQKYAAQYGKLSDGEVIQAIIDSRSEGLRYKPLSPQNKKYLGELIDRDPAFANFTTISPAHLDPTEVHGFSDSARMRIANLGPQLMGKVAKHHAYYHLITHFFRALQSDDEIIQRLLLRLSFTPGQAIAAAKGMTTAQKMEHREILVQMAEGSSKENEMREFLGVALKQSKAPKTPGELAQAVADGDRGLSEREWNVLLTDDDAVSQLIGSLKGGELTGLFAKAKSLRVNLHRNFVKSAQAYWDGGYRGKRDLLQLSKCLYALRKTEFDRGAFLKLTRSMVESIPHQSLDLNEIDASVEVLSPYLPGGEAEFFDLAAETIKTAIDEEFYYYRNGDKEFLKLLTTHPELTGRSADAIRTLKERLGEGQQNEDNVIRLGRRR